MATNFFSVKVLFVFWTGQLLALQLSFLLQDLQNSPCFQKKHSMKC